MKKCVMCFGSAISFWATGCVVTEAFLQAPFPRETNTRARGGRETLTSSVVVHERAFRQVARASSIGFGSSLWKGAQGSKARATAIATRTVSASKRSEDGAGEVLHERQADAMNNFGDVDGGDNVSGGGWRGVTEDVVTGGKRLARRLSISSLTTAAAAAATATMRASSLLVFLFVVSSSTEDDIMSAMRGLDASLSSGVDATGAPRGQPTLTLPAAGKGGTGTKSGGSSSGAMSSGVAQRGGGENVGGPSRGGGGAGSGGETDLMRTMGGSGGARQAGPLTHGF